MRAAVPMPAQLTRTRAHPVRRRRLRRRAAALGRVGDITGKERGRRSRRPRPRPFPRRDRRSATLAPASASARAVAAPRPEPPPVTKAVLPEISIMLPPDFRSAAQCPARRRCRPRRCRSAAPERSSSRASVSASRMPVAPSGWPMAMAPPLTLSLSSSSPSSSSAGQDLRAEGLVDLDAVDLVERQAGGFEHGADGGRRADAHDLGRHADRQRWRGCAPAA